MRKFLLGVLAIALSTSLLLTGCADSSSSGPDTKAPTVEAVTPGDGDTDVALNAMVAAALSERLDETTVDGATLVLVADGETEPVTATVAYDDDMREVICDPSYQLDTDTLYTATLAAAVTDRAGNLLEEGLTWSFTTSATDLAPPDVAALFPADGSMASAGTMVSVTYSEPLDAAPVDGAMTLNCGGVDITGTADFSGLAQTTFTPDETLTVGDSCTATFFATLTDAAANSGEASATWSFTVDYPRITGTPVAAGPVGAGTPVDIIVPVNAASDCATLTLTDGVDTFGGGSGCVTDPGDTEIVVSVDTLAGPGGDYLIEVLVESDGGGSFSEYLLDNTVSTENYTWTTSGGGDPEDSTTPLGYATLEPLPDLTVEILAAEDFGDVTQVWYEACNVGYADAGPFEVGVFINPAATPQIGDTPDGDGGIYGLPAGWCESDYIFAQGSLTFRATDIHAIVDSVQDVAESSETNNNGQTTWEQPGETYTSTDIPKAIPDGSGSFPGNPIPQTVTSTLPVASSIAALDDLVVIVDITHTWVGDLRITLISPAGTRVNLVSNRTSNAHYGSGYDMTVFDDTAATSITSGSDPFRGTYRPVQPLSTLAGQNPSGTWVLEVSDVFSSDTGTLHYWSIEIW